MSANLRVHYRHRMAKRPPHPLARDLTKAFVLRERRSRRHRAAKAEELNFTHPLSAEDGYLRDIRTAEDSLNDGVRSRVSFASFSTPKHKHCVHLSGHCR